MKLEIEKRAHVIIGSGMDKVLFDSPDITKALIEIFKDYPDYLNYCPKSIKLEVSKDFGIRFAEKLGFEKIEVTDTSTYPAKIYAITPDQKK